MELFFVAKDEDEMGARGRWDGLRKERKWKRKSEERKDIIEKGKGHRNCRTEEKNEMKT